MKKLSAAIIFFVLFCALLLCACKTRPEYVFNNVDRCEYTLTESGDHVANINKEKYLSSAALPPADAVDIRDHGASPSASASENAKAVNAAIRAAANGSGAVKVSAGRYYTGTVEMKSGVTLYLEEGAELSLPRYEEQKAADLDVALIKAENAHGWGIIGPGTLNGQGTGYTEDADESSVYYPPEEFELKERVLEARKRIRPRRDEGYNVIYARGCEDVKLSAFLIYEASIWTVNLENCDGVEIENLVIDNNIYVANSDGIDICSSSNVSISDCFIATGDDSVVVKTKTGAASNITVQNCEIMSLANNFKIGTETGFDVSGVSVSSCYFFTAECAGGYAGIAIESADGAHISEVSVSDIVMDNVTSPLLIWLGCRLDEEYGAKNTMGAIDGVTIENIDANNIDLPCAVVGCEYDGRRYKVKNASVRNVKAVYRDCYEDLHIYRGDKVLEANMDGYPEITRVSHRYFISHALSSYYDMPVYGIYVRDVENFVLENFSVTPRQGNTRVLTNFSA